MSLELIRESIRLSHYAGEGGTEAVVEHDIILPDAKPGAESILFLDGSAAIDNVSVSQGKVSISGNIDYKVLYASDDPKNPLASTNSRTSFVQILEMSGSEAGMRGSSSCDIEHIDYHIVNDRKINIKAILNLQGRVLRERQCNAITDVRGDDTVQALRGDMVFSNDYIGQKVCSVEESLEMPSDKPSVREVLRSDVKITRKENKVSYDKITVRCDLKISTLYIADDNEQSINCVEHIVPFSQSVEVPGLDEDARCQVEYAFRDLGVEVKEDSDGEPRILELKCSLVLDAEGKQQGTVSVLEDAYSTAFDLNGQREVFEMSRMEGSFSDRVGLKDEVELEDDEHEVVRVFNVIPKANLYDYEITEDKVRVEGVVENNIIYLTDNPERPICSCSHQIPFKHTIDIKGLPREVDYDISIDVTKCDFVVASRRTIGLDLSMELDAKALTPTQFSALTDISESSSDSVRKKGEKPSMSIYFVQPGDTVWNIAKHYRTTTQKIMGINSLEEDCALQPGTQLMVLTK